MSLSDLLYRCPECGRDPLPGEGDDAHCPDCGAGYARGDRGLEVLVTSTGGETRPVPAYRLTERIRSLGGPLPRATAADGEIRYEAAVTFRPSVSEDPVHFHGRLLGFAERRGEAGEGVLSVVGRTLTLREESRTRAWSILDLRALQGSSSSVQISAADGTVLQFAFPSDSSRRWEELLRLLISRAWSEEGRGRVVEYQPRIVCEGSLAEDSASGEGGDA